MVIPPVKPRERLMLLLSSAVEDKEGEEDYKGEITTD